MSHVEHLEKRKEAIRKKLFEVKLPVGKESATCWKVAHNVGVSGVTVRNYLDGKIADGYLAEEMYSVFKELKLT
jgi:hypothetical protein